MKLTQLLFPEAAWELSLNNPIGIYIHVPFCESKCAYCDFYSYKSNEITYSNYTAALCQHIFAAGVQLSVFADTLYFGGGTPSLHGGKRIAKIIKSSKQAFNIKDAEITVEVNPADNLFNDFKIMADAGVNRISVGVQSAIDSELKSLSRRHSVGDVIRTVNDAKNAGINNISVDLMIGIPHQTFDSLKTSLDFILGLDINHISCYMLKIEPNTLFGNINIDELNLPDNDTVADMYIYVSNYLKEHGFEHYEISNFALDGFRSKHNLKYWQDKEYLGFGPAAHSFLNNKRFYFERDTEKYIDHPEIIHDGFGGNSDEYIMLRLRLSDGINYKEYEDKFGKAFDKKIISKAKELEKYGLIEFNDNGFCLTLNGFLVSNTCISKLLS